MPLWDARVMDAVGAFQFPARQAGRKAVLMALAAHADFTDRVGKGACPAVESTVAKLANVDWRQAQRHVAALRLSGHIKAVGLNPIEGGRYTVVYEVALDDAQRLLWQAEAEGSFATWSDEMLPVIGDGGQFGHILRPPVTDDVRPTTSNHLQELRSCTRAFGTGSEENRMPAPGFEEDTSDKRQQRPSAPDDGPSGGVGRLDSADASDVAQKATQGLKAVSDEFRRRLEQHDLVLQHDTKKFLMVVGKRRREQGLTVETVAAMVALFFDDPSFLARHDRRRSHAWQYFLDRWSDLHQRVSQAQPEEYVIDPNKRKKDLEALGL